MATLQEFFPTQPDSTSGKLSASEARGMGFKPRADQISHTLPATHRRCDFERWTLTEAAEMTPKRVLSEYNKDLCEICARQMLCMYALHWKVKVLKKSSFMVKIS